MPRGTEENHEEDLMGIDAGHPVAGPCRLRRWEHLRDVYKRQQYLDLLLLADEQEDMIDRYLSRGRMYILDDDGIKCECVVTDEGNGVLEIKNIATVPEYQGKGYAKAMIDFVVNKYKGQYTVVQVGTGDSPLTIPVSYTHLDVYKRQVMACCKPFFIRC